MTVDFDGKYKTKLGRMTEIDFYTAVIGIANDETDKEVVRRILKKREEHAKKRNENQGETTKNRFKRLRDQQKQVRLELQKIVCIKPIKITKASTLDKLPNIWKKNGDDELAKSKT